MKNIRFNQHILPHLIAVASFYLVTLIFFSPGIFGNKTFRQSDIVQWEGSSKELRDYREATGEEGLWADAMFSGMPAYLVNTEWSDQIITYTKIIGSLGLPHPFRNIFLAIVSFYVLLLVYRVNPYHSIPFAIAFGITSYMMIGMVAGHNARIGAIAFLPLVLAGIHYTLHAKNKWGGLALTALAVSLHLRENHLQITYYILLILLFYIIAQGIYAYKNGQLADRFKGVLFLTLAAIISLGTFFGKFWSTYEYSKYSIRGASELKENLTANGNAEGLSKEYAFEYSNGIWEPMVLLVPNFYGGASSNNFVMDPQSDTYQALTRSQNPEQANQLVRFASAYWGPQSSTIPYYAGAIIVFFAILGLFFVPKTEKYWILGILFFGIILSWGDSFSSFNYFMFDYFPGYDKFRSVTFAIILALFGLPLLGALGLKGFLESTAKDKQKKLFISAGIGAGICLLIVLFSGLASFMREGDAQLPNWFLSALQSDRKGLMIADALRSFGFIIAGAGIVWLWMKEVLKPIIIIPALSILVFADIYFVSTRYLSDDLYQRPTAANIPLKEADQTILQDPSDYRVYNIMGDVFAEARTSYYHASVGGYHGAKLRRYQEFYEFCLQPKTSEMIQSLSAGGSMDSFIPVHMLNTKYLKYGETRNQVLPNPHASGSAWLVKDIKAVETADAELSTTCELNNMQSAVVNTQQFNISSTTFNNSGKIELTKKEPGALSYSFNAPEPSMVVFSEIYYPEGWTLTIDGEKSELIRANYILRAAEIPAGEHIIEMNFEPASYMIGNKIILGSNVLLLVLMLLAIILPFRNQDPKKDE